MVSKVTEQQEQSAIRMARHHISNVGDCLADEHELSQALLSMHGRLEVLRAELTEARKAISESDMLRSLAYSARDENHDAARGFQDRALRAERAATEYRKMAEEQQQARFPAALAGRPAEPVREWQLVPVNPNHYAGLVTSEEWADRHMNAWPGTWKKQWRVAAGPWQDADTSAQ